MQTGSGERRKDRMAEEELVETQAKLDSSRNEEGGLRRLNSARSRSVSWASSAGTPLYPTVGGVGS